MADSKKHLIGTGLSGLIGSKIVSVLGESFHCENIDLSHPTHPTDITKLDQVLQVVSASPAPVLLHCAAFTDVSAAWKQNGDRSGAAYQVNVVGTQNMVRAAAETGKHLIHISTAYVFNGKKETPYTEDDLPSPIEWYGQTKAEAEEIVLSADVHATVLRIDQPFRSDAFARQDVVRRILSQLRLGTLPPQFADHTMGPTFIDDFATVVRWAMETQPQGIYHASAGEAWTDFEFAQAICERFGISEKVRPGSLESYLKTSQRPYQKNTALDTTKLKRESKLPLLTIQQALAQVLAE